MSALRDAFLEYRANLGPTILVGADKRPLHKLNPLPAEIELLELVDRAHGVALRMWPESPVLGLDFDGPHAWPAWEATGITLPETARTRTRSGGTHLFFQIPPGTPPPSASGNGHDFRRKVRLVKAACGCTSGEGHPNPCGVDLLLNGYAVVPPTPGYSEDPDHPLELAGMAVLPQAVIDLARATEREGRHQRGAPTVGERIPDGQRNATLASLAGSMRRRAMSPEAILEALRVENRRCDPPLPDADLQKIARSVSRYAPAEQAEPPAADQTVPVTVEHLTDMGDARRLVAAHGRDLRYCHLWGCWLAWDGRRWQRDDSGEVFRRGKNVVRAIYAEASACGDEDQRKAIAKHAVRCEADSKVHAMLSMAESEPELIVRPEDFDRDPSLLNVQNGTVDVRTGELRVHGREDLITKLAPVTYDPETPCPMWKNFLERIFDNNGDLIAFLQRAVGYTLTASAREQCWLLLHGVGANGKTTLLRTLTDLLGDYATWTPTSTLLSKRGEHVENDLARLRGARMVAAVEAEGGRRLAEALIKQLTGGDPVTARFLYSEYFSFVPTLKLWFGTNHKPEIRGTDLAVWRRIRLIPFTVTIPEAEQDQDLPEKLRAEFPGILAWAVRGCLAWQQNGLGWAEAVHKATSEYRASMDLIGTFLEQCCEVNSEATVGAMDLYRAYVAWCEQSREHAETQRSFGDSLSEHGYRVGRHSVTGRKIRVGLRLRSEQSEQSEPLFGKV